MEEDLDIPVYDKKMDGNLGGLPEVCRGVAWVPLISLLWFGQITNMRSKTEQPLRPFLRDCMASYTRLVVRPEIQARRGEILTIIRSFPLILCVLSLVSLVRWMDGPKALEFSCHDRR